MSDSEFEECSASGVFPKSEANAQKHPCAVYEFRYNADEMTPQDLIDILKPVAKKFVFQLEKGDTGYLHYQGRMSLIKKRRKFEALKLFEKPPNYFEPTVSQEHKKTAFYCMKKDTRVGDIYTDQDLPPVLTRQVAEIKQLYPFQQQIVDDAKTWNKRTVNLVWCPDGNKGKTTLVQYCRAYKIGRPLPPVNDAKDLLRIVCCVPVSRMYLFDMPRAMKKEKLSQFFTAVESIKDGYAYDDRYEFKEKIFDCPNIWIFTNTIPQTELLSKDRWKIWTITEDKTLTTDLFTEDQNAISDDETL
jgi:hypothetical protein